MLDIKYEELHERWSLCERRFCWPLIAVMTQSNLLHKFTTLAYNICYVLSYLVLPDRYWFYRGCKFFSVYIIGYASPLLKAPNYKNYEVCIEGYAHSANSFVVSNIRQEGSVLSHTHRLWAVRGALNNGLPVVILLRHPLECALSKYGRSVANRLPGINWPIYPITGLATWYLYHRYIWSIRDRVSILPFSIIANNYQEAASRIAGMSAGQLRADPIYDYVNAFGEVQFDVRLSKLARLCLAAAEKLYQCLMEYEESRSHKVCPF